MLCGSELKAFFGFFVQDINRCGFISVLRIDADSRRHFVDRTVWEKFNIMVGSFGKFYASSNNRERVLAIYEFCRILSKIK